MKRDSLNYSMVGALVLVATVLLIYALARLSGHNEKHDAYYAIFPNVAGIADGSPVTFDGYQVGHVSGVEPVVRDGRTRYRVALLLKHDWKVPVDSTAAIGSSGLLSGQLIDVQQGRSVSYLAPGQDIRTVENVPLITALGGLASDLRNIAKDDIHPTMQNLNRRVDSLGNMLEVKGGTTLEQANTALQRFNVAADNLAQMLNVENRQHMTSMLKNGDVTAEKLSQTMADFEQSEVEIRYAMQQTKTILSNLERATRNINEFSRQLRENPSVIFTSPAPVDTVEAKK